MNSSRVISCLSAGLLGLGLMLVPRAKADVWDQKTTFTFNAPVEIPGRVLEPGTYVFKLADSLADRNIVEVWDKNEQHIFGTFIAIPDYHLRPAGKPIISFEERAAGSPEAVRGWFYPGENYGHVFVYPAARASELAKTNRYPVASMPNETASGNQPKAAMRQVPLSTQPAQPAPEQTQMAQAAPPPAQPETAPPPPANPPASAAPPENPQPANNSADRAAGELPATGSAAPLIALAGLLSLAAAGSLRFAAGRMK
jgi:LPXTG-motif cell wall-anchored protein